MTPRSDQNKPPAEHAGSTPQPPHFPSPNPSPNPSFDLLCCTGVDKPGLGRVHGAECPDTPGERAPQPLADFVAGRVMVGGPCSQAAFDAARRDYLLAQLVFAAKDLAQRNIASEPPGEFAGQLLALTRCRECHMTELQGHLSHTLLCRTGRVLGILDALVAEPTPQLGKEIAPGEESGAGSGIFPRGLDRRVCLQCGGISADWDWEALLGAMPHLEDLKLNQCAGVRVDWNGYVLYTHRCQQGGAQ